jgi:putative ABC transport system permease protein
VPRIARRWLRRFRYWLRFREHQDALEEEIALHRAMVADDLEGRGLSPVDARAAARRTMGNETATREAARGVWLSPTLDGMINDARSAWRNLRRAPVFTSVAVMTLALGIGANTAIFSVVRHLLIAPLPYPDGNRIVRIGTASPSAERMQFGVSTEVFREWSTRSRTLVEFAPVGRGQYRVGEPADSQAVDGASITPAFLPMLRARPVLGRAFIADDIRADAPPVMMIGERFWQVRYAGASDVVGRVLAVNGRPRTIIGVLSRTVTIPIARVDLPDLWLPLDLDSARVVHDGLARLAPGATSEAATNELQAIMDQRPDTAEKGFRAHVTRAQDRIGASERRALVILFVAVGGLLLIACTNVANLLLTRGWKRQRELAVRRAIGAGRLRLARQLMTESLMLAMLGGVVGVVIAWPGLRAIIALGPGGLWDLPGLDDAQINGAVLLWSVGVSVLTGLLFGVWPAFVSSGQTAADVLRIGTRGVVGSRVTRRLRGGMVIAQIALSLVFLVAASLLVRSFAALVRTPLGYEARGLVAVNVKLAGKTAVVDREAVANALVRSLETIPGVEGVASGGLPQTNVRMGPFAIDGPAGPQPIDLAFVEMPFVGAEYFRVARIALVEGRTFDADPASASRELVVNQRLARRLWPGTRVLGSRLRVGEGSDATWLTVVGVAGDLALPGAKGDLFTLQMYRPTIADNDVVSTTVLRINGKPTAFEPAIRRAVEDAGVSATFESLTAAERVFQIHVLARPRFALVLFVVFALIALVLSAVGLYAIVAHAVSQRTPEIGVRVALGAEPRAVARLVLRESFGLVAIGGVVGLMGAYAGTRAMRALLYELSPTDPVAFGAAAVLLAGVALMASLVPARRALRIDPVEALRAE